MVTGVQRAALALNHGQDVACRVPKPRDGRSLAAHDALFVQVHPAVVFKPDPVGRERVYRALHIGHRKVEDSVRGRDVVGFGIDQNGPRARNMQPEHPVFLADLKAKQVTVKGFRSGNVINREAAES